MESPAPAVHIDRAAAAPRQHERPSRDEPGVRFDVRCFQAARLFRTFWARASAAGPAFTSAVEVLIT